MAIKKKSIEQIAKENKLDISEENAQKVADAYIQPTLNQITTAEQNAVANTQDTLRSLENDYFNQYRQTQYNAQSRGLTGGLANLDANKLRMQMASANTNTVNNLQRQQAEFDTARGTALSNAASYKSDYLNKILQQVQALREQDYQQRYQEWYAQQQLALQRAQLAAAQQNSKTAENYQKLQAQAAGKEYYQNQMPEIYNRYKSILSSQGGTAAADYLQSVYFKEFKDYGISYKDFMSDVSNAQNIDINADKIKTAQDAYNAYSNRNLGQQLIALASGLTFGIPRCDWCGCYNGNRC